MKFKINKTIKLEDFLMERKELGYSMMKPSHIKELFGITNYGLKQIETILPVYRLGPRLKRYKAQDAFELVEKLQNTNSIL